MAAFATGDFVNFVDKEDAHLLDAVDGDTGDLVHVSQAILFLLDQIVERFGHAHLALLFLLAEHAGKHVLHVDVHLLHALIRDDFKRRHGALADFDFDIEALIELAPFAKLGAKLVASAQGLFAALRFRAGRRVQRNGRRRKEQIEEAILGRLLGALGHFVEFLFAHHVDGGLNQVADSSIRRRVRRSPTSVYFGGFHLDEGATGEAREAAGNFRLTDTGGADHEDIFRENFLGELGLEFLAAHCDCATQSQRLSWRRFGQRCIYRVRRRSHAASIRQMRNLASGSAAGWSPDK